MREEIILDTISWSAPAHIHKERSIDFFWTIGLITLVSVVVAIIYHNYIFAIFLVLSGVMLIVVNFNEPEEVNYEINTKEFKIGREKYEWKRVKGFDILKKSDESKLLVEIDKHILPIYSITIPEEFVEKIDRNLIKIIPNKEIKESKVMLFSEKIGL